MTPRQPMLLALVALLACLLVSACSTTQPSVAPASVDPTDEAQAPPGRPAVLGCTDIEAGQCEDVAARIIATLTLERGAPFSVQIRLGRCPDDPTCPKTLGVRQGDIIIEYLDGGEPIHLSLAGSLEAPVTAPLVAAWSGIVQPSSARAGGPGPFAFDVGHCGLTHVVDFDGSFWIPVGVIDGAEGALVNSERGTMRLAGLNLAEYRGRAGFSMALARWPGPKRFFLCD